MPEGRKIERSRNRGSGLAIGLALGVVFEIIFDNIAIGIAVGIAVGIAIGEGLEARNARATKKNRIKKSKEENKSRNNKG